MRVITNTVAELLSAVSRFIDGRNNFPFLARSASLILVLSVLRRKFTTSI